MGIEEGLGMRLDVHQDTVHAIHCIQCSQVATTLLVRPWQIIPQDSPIILFFYSQIFGLLFSQTSPLFFQTSLLFLHYSQTHVKNFINKT